MNKPITIAELVPAKYRIPTGILFSPAIEERIQADGTSLWSVSNGRSSDVLNKEGEWEYEPQPSSRDAGFLKRCRFSSVEEALTAFNNRKVSYD